MDKRLYSTGEVLRIFGISRATLYRFIASGKLPKPIRGLTRESRFLASEIEEHYQYLLDFNGKIERGSN